jgi:hypothetical protein
MLAGWLARPLAASHFFKVDDACANLAISRGNHVKL